MIGSVLGKYRIEAELSRGGMGAVYRARHEIIDRTVAVKLLRPELTENTELVTRFINEAKAASAIRHPSIIEIIDFGTADDGRAYLVMEFLEGDSLANRIAKRKRMSEHEAARIVRSIAGALSAAHAKGIIHRDLKPDNVFLVPDPDVGERAKVLDFGIAKLADVSAGAGRTQTGALMGTPLYMAPEQARAAGSIDHRADLYSLGCIFYELLTGEPPLKGEGAGEIIAMQMFTVPDPPSTRGVTVSPAVEQIVMKLLEKEPGARFGSASELSNALAAAVGGNLVSAASVPQLPRASSSTSLNPVAAASPSLIERPAAARPRNTMPLIAGGIVLAIVGVVAAVVLVTGSREDTQPAPSPPPIVAPRIEREEPKVERPKVETPTIETAETPAPAPVSPAPAPAPTEEPAPAPAPKKLPKKQPASQPTSPTTTPGGFPAETTL